MSVSSAERPRPDPEQIARTLAVLHAPKAVIELRALHTKGRKRTDAGYFDGEHRDQLVREAVRLNSYGAAVYVTLNPIDPQLLARCANRVQEFAQATATDNNVLRRQWLLIDIDPQRPKDTSATSEQLALALERATTVHEFLTQCGWPTPASADSGNGLHFLYRVDLPNDGPSRDLVKQCLEALAARFDDDAVKVDTSVHNAGRIVKLHGTVANKGDDVPAAPWRLSQLRTVPENLQTVRMELLQALAAEVRSQSPTRPTYSGNSQAWTESDVQNFLARGGIESTGPEPHDGLTRWKLKACPFNPDHAYGEAAVFLRPDGRLGFECRHNSCQHRHWRDLRGLVDGARALSGTRLGPHGRPDRSDELPPGEAYEGEPQANGHARAVERTESALPGVNFADMRPHLDDNYVVKGVFGRKTLVGVIGPSGEGKTFFCTDVAVHIAAKTMWRHYKIRGGLVVYVALEGAASAENRFCAARSALNLPHRVPLKLTPGALNLRDPADVDRLIAFVRAAEAEHGVKVTAIFVDTLNRAMCGGDENTSEDMGALIAGADRLRLATDATVILIHHTGKDTSRGGRGHSSFKGALDTEIEVVKAGNVHVATVTKQRDYAGGARYAFALEVVELGQDSDGEAVTTCIVRAADEPAPQRQAPTGKNQTALLAALQEWQRQHEGAKHISSVEFRSIAKTQGIPPKRLPEAIESLSKLGCLGQAVGGYSLFPEASE